MIRSIFSSVRLSLALPFISLLACDPFQFRGCPNDPQPKACEPGSACCAEQVEFQKCKERQGLAICNSDGKTDSNRLLARCENELAKALQCGIGPTPSPMDSKCEAYAAQAIGFASQPSDLKGSSPGTVQLTGIPSNDFNVSCDILRLNGEPAAGTCNYVLGTGLMYGSLSEGMYRLRLKVDYSTCAPRTVDSDSFEVTE